MGTRSGGVPGTELTPRRLVVAASLITSLMAMCAALVPTRKSSSAAFQRGVNRQKSRSDARAAAVAVHSIVSSIALRRRSGHQHDRGSADARIQALALGARLQQRLEHAVGQRPERSVVKTPGLGQVKPH